MLYPHSKFVQVSLSILERTLITLSSPFLTVSHFNPSIPFKLSMVFYSLHTSLSIKNKRPSHQGIPNCPLRRSGLLPSQVSPSGSENQLVLALPPNSSRPPV